LIYLDTSVAVALCSNETLPFNLADWMQSLPADSIWISQWTLLEGRGALCAKQRGGRLTRTGLTLCQSVLSDLVAGPWRVVDALPGDMERAAHWAGEPALVLRGGDALHLAIADRNGLAVATLDRGMTNAANKLGLALAEFG
jgi:uncharacterized protein